MSSNPQEDAKESNINESWVELNMSVSPPLDTAAVPLAPGTIASMLLEAQRQSPDPAMSKPLSHGNMEKLLLEAQKEWSRNSSRMGSNVASTTGSTRSSPKSPRSPSNELATSMPLVNLHHTIPEMVDQTQQTATDWIWDWSSRPEIFPPGSSELAVKRAPPVKRAGLSVRNTKVMQNGPFSMENLPIMIITHACTFFLGAAVMFVYLKKYCGWSSVLGNSMD